MIQELKAWKNLDRDGDIYIQIEGETRKVTAMAR